MREKLRERERERERESQRERERWRKIRNGQTKRSERLFSSVWNIHLLISVNFHLSFKWELCAASQKCKKIINKVKRPSVFAYNFTGISLKQNMMPHSLQCLAVHDSINRGAVVFVSLGMSSVKQFFFENLLADSCKIWGTGVPSYLEISIFAFRFLLRFI